MAAVVVTGIAEIDRAMAAATDKVQKKIIRGAQRVVAKDVRDSARDHAPIQFGDLHDSIKVRALRRSRKNKDIVGVRVVTSDSDSMFRGETFYGGFQEYGTVNMEANPFLFPAMLENEGRAKQKYETAVAAAVRELGR